MQINESNVMQAVQDPKNWKRTRKKSYEVYMCMPEVGTQCSNFLEGSNYVTDQNKRFILSGTVGETWVIDANKLAKTYTFEDGTPITPETLKKKSNSSGLIPWTKLKTKSDATTNWAIMIPKMIQNFPVQTSWGDVLYANRPEVKHGYGDFLLCPDDGSGNPNLNDVWVVNGAVFPTTYDLRAFRGLFDEKKVQASTPVPKHKFVKEKKGINKFQALIKLLYNYAMKIKPTYGFDKIEIGPEKNASRWTDDTKSERWALFISSAKDPDKSIVMHTLAVADRVVVESFNNKSNNNSDKCFICSDTKRVNNMFLHIKAFFNDPACESIGDAKIDTSHKDKEAMTKLYEYAKSKRLTHQFKNIRLEMDQHYDKKHLTLYLESNNNRNKRIKVYRDNNKDTDTAIALSYDTESDMDGQYFFRYSDASQVERAFLVFSMFFSLDQCKKIEDVPAVIDNQTDMLKIYEYAKKNKAKYAIKELEIRSSVIEPDKLAIDLKNNDKNVTISIDDYEVTGLANVLSHNTVVLRQASIEFNPKYDSELVNAFIKIHKFFTNSKFEVITDVDNSNLDGKNEINEFQSLIMKLYNYAMDNKETYGCNKIEIGPETDASRWTDDTKPERWTLFINSSKDPDKSIVMHTLAVADRVVIESFNNKNPKNSDVCFSCDDTKEVNNMFLHIKDFFTNDACESIGAAKIDTSHKDKEAIQKLHEYADSNRRTYKFNKVNTKFTECCYKKRWRILIKSEYGPTKYVTIHRDSESDTDTAVVLSYETESFTDGQYLFRYSNDAEVAQAFLVISLFLRNEKFTKIEDAAKLVESGQKDILQLYDYIIKNKQKYGFKQVEISSAAAYDEDLIIDISNDDKEVRISIDKNSSLARIRSSTNTYFDYKSQKELDDVLDRLHRFFKDSKARDLNDIENKGNKSKEVMNKLYKYANEGKEKYGFSSVELKADETIPNKWLVVIASNDAQNKVAVMSRLDNNKAILETFNIDNDLSASKPFDCSKYNTIQSILMTLSNFFKNPAANTILDV